MQISRSRSGVGFRLAAALVLFGLGTGCEPTTPPREVFSPTGSMGTDRTCHTATLLFNGKVLITGSDRTGSAELYDPSTGTFSPTGSMGTVRGGYTATLLPNGKVLITGGATGGWDSPSTDINSAELYDPASGTFSSTASMGAARHGHTATLLPNGKVLIAGGWNSNRGGTAVTSAELYDPATETFATTGSMDTCNDYPHTATLLPNGKVLIIWNSTYNAPDTAVLYDPATGTFSPTVSMGTSRYYSHTATLLPNGKVLITGGDSPYGTLDSAMLYDPATGTFSPTASMNAARYNHTATLLSDGKVLIAGGRNSPGYDRDILNYPTVVEVYDSASGTFFAIGNMGAARMNHTATLLPNGKVLIAGGSDSSRRLASAELFQ